MQRHFLFLGLGGLLLWSACTSPSEVEDPEQALIVQAYLVPGQDTQVKVRQTLPPEEYYDGLEDTLSSALVEIETGGETFALAEDPAEPGTYRISRAIMPVISGETYRLRVSYQDRQLRASTTVPFKAAITEITADTLTYYQHYADLYGDLIHPGEFRWTQSENAAGYVIVVEAVEVRALNEPALPLTGDLDSLIALRARLTGQVGPDSLAILDQRIEALRSFLAEKISLTRATGEEIRWLRNREQEEWDEIEGKNWSEGKKWRERMDKLFWASRVNYLMPADTLRSDYWWMGLRFEGEYRVRLQAADRNYFDYFATAQNGASGNDGDKGPLFHVEGGVGVFGSYAEDSFRVIARRGEDGVGLKIATAR